MVFTDYQCPFCQRLEGTLEDLQKKYPKDVRVVVKHFPLSFHKQAEPAHRAAIAAGKQGKFWEMHDLLFASQREFRAADMNALTRAFAKQLSLDVDRFERDMQSSASKGTVADDMKLGEGVGVRGTPHTFVNGIRVSGAQPLTKFEEVVRTELADMRKAKGSTYASRVETNYEAPAARPKPTPKPPAVAAAVVPVGKGDAVRGNTKDFLVTIVEFSDMQCPFCARVNPTLEQVLKEHEDVRLVFKHNPLAFHKEAEPAARASWAAGKQGKFWEMHDKLFANQSAMRGKGDAGMQALAEEYAADLGLNIKRFRKDMDSAAARDAVKADQALAAKVGARGTPNFFVNGVKVIGAQPFDKFYTVVKEQRAIAKDIMKAKKLSGDALYMAASTQNVDKLGDAAKPATKPADIVDTSLLAIGSAPTHGNAKFAKVIIYEFTDLQCPFCSRANSTVQQIRDTYGDKVLFVAKNLPLPFHKEAEPAALAALAADRQGKYWEMRDEIFKRQKELRSNPKLFIEIANDIGLNVKRFERDMDDPKLRKIVEADKAMAAKVGARGTPTFIVNDKRVVGAQPFSKFKEVIDAELK